MQTAKSAAGRRVSREPEKVYVNEYLLDEAIGKMTATAERTYADLTHEPGMETFRGVHVMFVGWC